MPKTRGSRKNSNRYNNIVYIIASILLVAVLVFTGWYLYGQSHSTQQSSTTNTVKDNPANSNVEKPNETPKDDIAQAGDIFKIPELGIQFVLPEGLEGLEYEMIYDNNVNKVASFSSRSLIKADSRCNPKNGTPLGAITSMPDTTDPKELLGPYVTLSDENFKHINGRYVILQAPQSGCSDKMDVGDLQTRQVNLLYESYKNTITLIAP